MRENLINCETKIPLNVFLGERASKMRLSCLRGHRNTRTPFSSFLLLSSAASTSEGQKEFMPDLHHIYPASFLPSCPWWVSSTTTGWWEWTFKSYSLVKWEKSEPTNGWKSDCANLNPSGFRFPTKISKLLFKRNI